ncbi:acetyltransferase [Maribacter polysaccharolyticus]|uniref:acetyltransferase n=1 Tax=Maribacter polysaccharolyticus TaxID=3020831 RepID=UPI00237FD485|nr:acetyltransferase [Maribacter polysaccharolyticus]MDE3743527.1 acetyltransferase [Maribacter polysaccharolyticus]
MISNDNIDINKPLHILGFVPEILNVLLELADDTFGFQSFRVLENINRISNKYFVSLDRYNVKFKNFYKQEYTINPNDSFAFGVVGVKSKEIVYRFFKEKIGMCDESFLNLIHPTAVLSNSVRLNNGIQVGIHTSINVLTEIGFGVNIKNQCYIGHHGKIGDFVTINPGVTVNGFVEIGNNTQIGAGAIIRDKIKIGANCIIGMGSNVIKDIPDNSIAFGNPCKVHQKNN